MRKYTIVRATGLAKKVMRKQNRKKSCSIKVREQKKYAMKQYRKMIETKKVKPSGLGQDFSKNLEMAILATIGLAVLSVAKPQLGILASIFSILIVAVVMDTKIRNMNEKSKKESDDRIEQLLQLVRSEKKFSAIEVAAAKRKIKEIEAKQTSITNRVGATLVSSIQKDEGAESIFKNAN